MLTAYLDESHDGKKERVLLLAGYFAHDENWDRLWTRWAQLLKTLGIPEFHAAECQRGRGHFAGMSPERTKAIQKQFVDLLSDRPNGLIGHLSAIKMEAYAPLRQRFKSTRRIPSGRAVSGTLDDPYFLGLQLAVEGIAGGKLISMLPETEKVNFVLDESALGGRALALYGDIKRDESLGAWTKRLGDIRTAASVDCIPLQAADLWAFEALHYSDRHFAGNMNQKSWQFSELEPGIDWTSAKYFDERGLLKVLEILEARQRSG